MDCVKRSGMGKDFQAYEVGVDNNPVECTGCLNLSQVIAKKERRQLELEERLLELELKLKSIHQISIISLPFVDRNINITNSNTGVNLPTLSRQNPITPRKSPMVAGDAPAFDSQLGSARKSMDSSLSSVKLQLFKHEPDSKYLQVDGNGNHHHDVSVITIQEIIDKVVERSPKRKNSPESRKTVSICDSFNKLLSKMESERKSLESLDEGTQRDAKMKEDQSDASNVQSFVKRQKKCTDSPQSRNSAFDDVLCTSNVIHRNSPSPKKSLSSRTMLSGNYAKTSDDLSDNLSKNRKLYRGLNGFIPRPLSCIHKKRHLYDLHYVYCPSPNVNEMPLPNSHRLEKSQDLLQCLRCSRRFSSMINFHVHIKNCRDVGDCYCGSCTPAANVLA